MRNLSGIAAARPLTKNASAAVHVAAHRALAVSRYCGLVRSARLNTAEVTAPTTNPICTEAVSQTAAVDPIPHCERRLGTTAVAENQTLRPNTSTSAIERSLLVRAGQNHCRHSGQAAGIFVEREQRVDFGPHGLAQLSKVLAQLYQIPAVARDALGDVE